ncbi:MAG TPA: type I 3-dehydroquinate dehydratase, partial [Bacteroidota bacterium]|nr:type I 3-dehydroquinate dehydratase [Bacteroidota bacterium]
PRDTAARLMEALSMGADYIDAEFSLGPVILRELFDAAGREKIILSFHDPKRTPVDLVGRFRTMASLRPAFVKIAVLARSFADTELVLAVLAEARRIRQPAVAISMGEFGAYTRILQGPLGGAITYAAFDGEKPTAPGQTSFGEMDDPYRVPGLNSRTKIFGLLGNPVSFSRGIQYHNGVFSRKKKNAVYVNFPADDIGDFMRIFGKRFTGLSVTMPFKKSIAGHLDRIEGSSLLTGSVNTVVRKSGRLTGLNTDFHAFLSLLNKRTRITGRRMLVLGTGGTAGTVAGAGVLSGAVVTVAGRDPRKARDLANRFGCGWIPLSEQRSFHAEILVNATPVGMDPGGGPRRRERIVAASTLGNYDIVCDFANPPSGRTSLVQDAIRHRRGVITGAEIFAAQARLQSQLFLQLI